MRKITVPLLIAGYISLALTAGLFVWRAGAGWGSGLALTVAVLAALLTIHAILSRAIDRHSLSAEIAQVREAHVILADQIEQMDARLAAMSEEAHAEAEELTGEVRMLEHLIQRMGESGVGRGRSDGYAPDLGENVRVMPGVSLPDPRSALLETVREALADNRVDLYLQPVVSLPQRRTVFYESFSRLRDETGRVMMPAEYLALAEHEGLVSAIDNLLLFRCVQIVRRLAKQDRKVGIFCNIALTSLADEVFFPQFLEFLSQNKDLHGALIFELGQHAFGQRGSVEARNMAKLADLGFQFSIDKVSDLDLDFQDLQRSDVKFIKIGAETLLDQLLEVDGQLALKAMKDINAADFADLTRRYGVEIIAEKVENERQVIDVLELNISYGQGHLFGQPRAIRDAVLAEADPPANFISPALRRRVAGR
jgi:cyclic-di-GMP phosphodiesterase TipF (flagellum assembly factor)